MNTEVIMNGLVEIIKQGGPLALGGVAIWLIIGLVKVLVVLWVVYLVVKIVCKTILDYKVASFKQVQLLSQEVSSNLVMAMEAFTASGEQLFKKFESQLEELKKSAPKT